MKQVFRSLPAGRETSIWSQRDVWLMLPARTIVAMANGLALVTLLLRVHDGGHGAMAVAGLMAAFAVPAVATMGLSGHVADRYDSRWLLAVGLAVQALAAAGLAVRTDLAATFLLVAMYETGQSVVGPVWAGLLPRIVGEERIGNAVAWQQGLAAIAGPAGAALGGVLYQLHGGRVGLVGTAATAVVALATSLALRTRRHVRAEHGPDRPPPRTGMLDGVRIVRADPVVWPLFVAILVVVLLVEGTNAVEVFLARDALGASAAQYGFGEIASAIGGVLGAALAGAVASDAHRVTASLAGFGTTTLAVAAAGVAPGFGVYLGIVVVLAAAAGVGNASAGALLIGRTADRDRGKVSAGLNGLARTATLVALAAGGLANALVGPRRVFVAAGLAGTAAIVVAAAARRRHAAAALVAPG